MVHSPLATEVSAREEGCRGVRQKASSNEAGKSAAPCVLDSSLDKGMRWHIILRPLGLQRQHVEVFQPA